MASCGLAGGYHNFRERYYTIFGADLHDLRSVPHSYITCYFPYLYLTYTLKMEAMCSSKVLVSTDQTTWCHNSEDHNIEVWNYSTVHQQSFRVHYVVLHLYGRAKSKHISDIITSHGALHHERPNIGDGIGCLIHLQLEDCFETTWKFSVNLSPSWPEFSNQMGFQYRSEHHWCLVYLVIPAVS
jgi:hypothetical protein